MKCFFIAEFERAAELFQTKKWPKNQSKSIKFVTSCAGHADGMKNG